MGTYDNHDQYLDDVAEHMMGEIDYSVNGPRKMSELDRAREMDQAYSQGFRAGREFAANELIAACLEMLDAPVSKP